MSVLCSQSFKRAACHGYLQEGVQIISRTIGVSVIYPDKAYYFVFVYTIHNWFPITPVFCSTNLDWLDKFKTTKFELKYKFIELIAELEWHLLYVSVFLKDYFLQVNLNKSKCQSVKKIFFQIWKNLWTDRSFLVMWHLNYDSVIIKSFNMLW